MWSVGSFLQVVAVEEGTGTDRREEEDRFQILKRGNRHGFISA
jgi:hypothetical protein